MVQKLIIVVLCMGAITCGSHSFASQRKRSPSTNPFSEEFTPQCPPSPPAQATPFPSQEFTYRILGTDIVLKPEDYDPTLTPTPQTEPSTNPFAQNNHYDRETDTKHKSSSTSLKVSRRFPSHKRRQPNHWRTASLVGLTSLAVGAVAFVCHKYGGKYLPTPTPSPTSNNPPVSLTTSALKETGSGALQSMGFVFGLGTLGIGSKNSWLRWFSNLTPWGRKYNETQELLEKSIAMARRQTEESDRNYAQNLAAFKKIVARLDASYDLNKEIDLQLTALEKHIADERDRAQILIEICNQLQKKSYELSKQARSFSSPEALEKHMHQSEKELREYARKLIAEKMSQFSKKDK
jgi:hypothetical protein